MKQARKSGLENVVFLDRQPKSAMPALWSLCDVSLITLKDQPLFSTVIPSKIFESMGMGLPIILSLPEGEAAEIIRTTRSGLVIPPEDPAALASAVQRLSTEHELRGQLARSSADAAADYSRDVQAARMLHTFDGNGVVS